MSEGAWSRSRWTTLIVGILCMLLMTLGALLALKSRHADLFKADSCEYSARLQLRNAEDAKTKKVECFPVECLSRAQEGFECSIAIREKKLGTEHPKTIASRMGLAFTLVQLAMRGHEAAVGNGHDADSGFKNESEAETRRLLNEAEHVYKDILRIREENSSGSSGLIEIYTALASYYSRVGNLEESNLYYGKWIEVLKKERVEEMSESFVIPFSEKGKNLTELREYEEARPLLERSLAILRSKYGEQHVKVGEELTSIGRVYWSLSSRRDSEKIYFLKMARESLERALEIKKLQPLPEVTTTLTNLGNVYYDLDDVEGYRPDDGVRPIEKSISNFKEVYDIRFRHPDFGPTHEDTVRAMSNLSEALLKSRNYVRAKDLCQRAVEVPLSVGSRFDPSYCYYTLAIIYRDYEAGRDYPRSEEYFRKAMGMQAPGHPYSVKTCREYVVLLRRWEHHARADNVEEECRR